MTCIVRKFHQQTGRTGHREIHAGENPHPVPQGRLPRITKMIALAILFEHLIKESIVKDQAELARLGHVSRARITQIMNLLNLAPGIQEEILFLPRIERGRDKILEWELREIASVGNWATQRRLWADVSD